MTDKNLLLQDDAFAPPVPDSLDYLPTHHCDPVTRVAASFEEDLLDIVRTLVCMADRMALPGSENYPSPLSHFSPLIIAARKACVERGFTAGGLAMDATKGKSQ